MVKLIMGLKGSGKTKLLVNLVRKAVEEENGAVICIEKDKNLTYDIPYTCRLIHAGEYAVPVGIGPQLINHCASTPGRQRW